MQMYGDPEVIRYMLSIIHHLELVHFDNFDNKKTPKLQMTASCES